MVHKDYSFDSAQDRAFWWDDFEGDFIKDGWNQVIGGTGSIALQDGETGGVVRMTTGNVANDACYLTWNDTRSLHFDKHIRLMARFRASHTDNIQCRIQLHYDWNNFILCLMSASDWGASYYAGSKDDGTADSLVMDTARDTSWHTILVECHTHGSDHFHFILDGTEESNSPKSTYIPSDAGDYLEPLIQIETYNTTPKWFEIDYIGVEQDR